jgi:BUD22
MKRRRSFAQRRPSSISDDKDATFRKNQVDYYNRLFYKCHKDLNKHAKITKKFEIQKQIRKIKELPSQKNGAEPMAAKQEKKLQQLKDYCTEPIIDECFRRLGIKQLDPTLQFSPCAEANGKAIDTNESLRLVDPIVNSSTDSSVDHRSLNAQVSDLDVVGVEEKVENEWILDRIMKHKTIISALDHWNDEVTEYRRWCLRQQERMDGESSEISERSHKKGKKTTKNGTSDSTMNGSSLFVSLGSGATNGAAPGNFDSDPFCYYGPDGGDDSTMKKNRQGQRGRRAKAAAIEAKKHGRVLRPEESLNWRAPKTQPEQTRGVDSKYQISAVRRDAKADASVPSMKSSMAIPVEELHPSWQARKGQKEGIVSFQGKKITFDDV